MIIRKSQLDLAWEDLLSGEEIKAWVTEGKRFQLPKDPGVYLWTFPAEGSGKPCAYVGEGINLAERLAPYLNMASRIASNKRKAPDGTNFNSPEEELSFAHRENRKQSVVRIAAKIAQKCGLCRLQRRKIVEEAIALAIEFSTRLLEHKAGRVLLESVTLIEMERHGYHMLNRNFPNSKHGRELREKLPHLSSKRA